MAFLFSADYHLGHKNIIKYCDRPFKSIEEMNERIIKSHNNVVKADDIVYHLGDFSFNDRRKYEDKLNGKIVHLVGNHDMRQSSVLKFAFFEFGNMLVMGTHVPPKDLMEVPAWCDLILAGHLHEKWKDIKLVSPEDRKPRIVINVGVDQWNFRPISIQEIIKHYNLCLKKYDMVEPKKDES